MKRRLNRMVIPLLFLAACQTQSSKVQAFIDGVYVNHTKGDLSVADDTLRFSRTDADHYLISRRTGYQAIRRGKLLTKHWMRERLEGVFDPQHGVVNETTTGRVFRFDPGKGILMLKAAVYHKLN